MKAEVFTEKGWVELKKHTDAFKYNDVLLEIKNNVVYISAENTAIGYVRLTKENDLFTDAKVMGDCWERAYGDMEWKSLDYNRFLPWYFTAANGEKIYCFGVKTQPNAFCGWKCDAEKITLVADIRNGSNLINLNGRCLEICTVVEYKSTNKIYETQKKFCKLMCDAPKLTDKPVYGGNDWYCNYGENSFEKIIEHTKRIVECSKNCKVKPYMVIDDGWQSCHCLDPLYNGGPWSSCNYKFNDMSVLAKKIKKLGAIPGIWFRPLLTFEDTPSDGVLKRNGFEVYLDPSSDDVLQKVSDDVKRLVKWGYKLIKHDFSTFDIFGKWGFEFEDFPNGDNVVFKDKTKTTAEIIKNLYKVIRKSAGKSAVIIGCNTISHLSAGLFEIQRTGDDTSGREWDRTKKYGINTLAYRMAQHNTFYCADADCVGITNDIDFEKNKMWMDVVAKSGTALFVSIAHNAYTEEVKTAVTKAFEMVCAVKSDSYPLDWMETKTPQKWQSVFGEDTYLW